MKNYKEKSLHHIKRKMANKYIAREYSFGTDNFIELIMYFKQPLTILNDWKACYNYLKSMTRSTKRSWIERLANQDNTIWDTDLEPKEQDYVDYLLEYFDYQQGSFEIEELRELLGENTDNENMVNACSILIDALSSNKNMVNTCSILIDALISNKKTLLEVE